jgi:hypothetical protein
MAKELDAQTLLNTIVEGLSQPFYAVDRDRRITIYDERVCIDAVRETGHGA